MTSPRDHQLNPLGARPAAGHGPIGNLHPAGPADAGRLDSTMIGAVACFHPRRPYMSAKLGDDIDQAARTTLETIWAHFVPGGFRHDAAWNAYGGHLTLQLAHAFLLTGDIAQMDACLAWVIGDAACATVSEARGPQRDCRSRAWASSSPILCCPAPTRPTWTAVHRTISSVHGPTSPGWTP
jgi:hypothetical protein